MWGDWLELVPDDAAHVHLAADLVDHGDPGHLFHFQGRERFPGMMTCGIDPGLHGGIALVNGDGALLEVHPMPTTLVKKGKRNANVYAEDTLLEMMSTCPAQRFVVESLVIVPGNGKISLAVSGDGYGLIRGMLKGLGKELVVVSPRTWQAQMLPKTKGRQALKEASINVASELWGPGWFHGPMGGPKDGLSDAALIAVWGRLHGWQ